MCGRSSARSAGSATGADVTVSVAHADNSLTGNGLQDYRLLDRDYASVYTKPDMTDNRSTLLNVSAQHRLRRGLSLLGNAYYRDIRTDTLNGDINEESLDQALYQPNAAERAALAAAGYSAIPGQRRRRQQHAVSVAGAASATCCSTTSRRRSATA